MSCSSRRFSDNPGIIDLKFAQSVFEDEPIIVVEVMN